MVKKYILPVLFRFILPLCFATFLLPAAAAAENSPETEERITRFDAQATVNADGSVSGTEEIAVIAHGESIRHGVYRDLSRRVRLESVEKDGRAEPYFTRVQAGIRRLYIGSKDDPMPDGDYLYRITYHVPRAVIYEDSHDELRWIISAGGSRNVPLDTVRVSVTLPDGAEILLYHAATKGGEGSARDYTARVEENTVHFETTRRLEPDEVLIVTVSWPKGFVDPPGLLYRVLEQYGSGRILSFLIFCILIGAAVTVIGKSCNGVSRKN